MNPMIKKQQDGQPPPRKPTSGLQWILLAAITISILQLLSSSSSAAGLFGLGPMPDGYMFSPSFDCPISTAASLHPPLPPSAFVVNPLYQAEYERIDHGVTAEERCAAFGLKPNEPNPDGSSGTSPQQRRLFFGSLIADESWELINILATEVYNVYHVVALVESNTTHTITPRKMRFHGNTELEHFLRSGAMFGNQTRFMLDYFMEHMPRVTYLNRDYEQMTPVVKMWKDAGMTVDDVGIIADLDEVPSRDFLRALQVCDFPQFRPGQDCQYPKICLHTTQFESSPQCIKTREWYHPDIISGQCFGEIGDPTERVVPLRDVDRQYGMRVQSYGKDDPDSFPQAVKDSGRFPLFAGRDVREVAGCRGLTNYQNRPGHGETAVFSAAYHFHNWFDDFRFLRHKYKTYSHATDKAIKSPLSEITEDLDMMVRCARNLGNKVKVGDSGDYYFSEELGRIPELGGNRPIFFVNETYTIERHAMLQKMVAEDEEKFGTSYPVGENKTE
jgi:hypothetical protein